MRSTLLYIFSTVALLLCIQACQSDDALITDSSAKLEFSVDTLRFDTVFTELGSATKFIRVYNRHDNPINISEIRLEAGDQSFFRINVDGIPGDPATDIEVPANDSIYIFAEVLILSFGLLDYLIDVQDHIILIF